MLNAPYFFEKQITLAVGVYLMSTRSRRHQLARLMERAPWSEVITKTAEREWLTRCEHVYYCFNPAGLREVETVDDINEFLESGGVEV